MASNLSYDQRLHLDRKIEGSKTEEYLNLFKQNVALNGVNPFREDAHCTVCGSVGRKLFDKRLGTYSYCESCQHIYLSKVLSDKYLHEWYKNHPSNTLSWHHREKQFYADIYNSGIQKIKNSLNISMGIKTYKLLDIGCSSGYFMRLAEKSSFEAFGLEINTLEAEHAIKSGCKIIGETLDMLGREDFFDVITMWDVLEHITIPVDYLRSIKNHLIDGGMIFFQVPSSDSIAARLLHEHCKMFDGIEHITLFSQKSIHTLLTLAGYQLISITSVIPEIHCLSNRVSYAEDLYTSSPQTDFLELMSLTPQNILDHGMGYKYQVCAIAA